MKKDMKKIMKKRKFHHYPTLLTSTEKQLTQATFKLAPSGTLVSCYVNPTYIANKLRVSCLSIYNMIKEVF